MTVYRQHFEKALNATNLGLLVDSYIRRTDLSIVRELDPNKKKVLALLGICVFAALSWQNATSSICQPKHCFRFYSDKFSALRCLISLIYEVVWLSLLQMNNDNAYYLVIVVDLI